MLLWKAADDTALAAFSRAADAPVPAVTCAIARAFAVELGAADVPIAWATQVHGNAVLDPSRPAAGATIHAGEGDILASCETGFALVVQTADCVPILLAAPGAVSAVHAGWRGTARGAAVTAVRHLAARYGVSPESIRAFLGPAIGPCCYEVGGDVAANFAGEFVRRGCGGKFLVNLQAANRAQLAAEGVPESSIAAEPRCTRCGGADLASYRRDGARAGRMIALIALRAWD
jgi:polyphenol oxidase